MKRKKSDNTPDHAKELLYSARRNDALLGRREVNKERRLRQEVTADDITDLDSVEEDGQVMLRETRPLWRTPTKMQLLQCLMNLGTSEKARLS